MKQPTDPDYGGCHAPCLSGESNPKCFGRGCLIARAMAGDFVASEIVFERLARALLVQARRMCFNPHDAEDLVQDALLHSWEHLKQLRVNRQVLPWARQIVRNSFLMSKRRSLFAPIVIEGLDSHENALRTEAHIAERIAAAEVARGLSRALEQVPEILSKTFELRVLLGLSTEETARRLGVTLYVVRTRLRRARIALRRLSSH